MEQDDQQNNQKNSQYNIQQNNQEDVPQNSQQNTPENIQQNNQITEALAITYPEKDDDNIHQVPLELRDSSALLGLLKFVTESTKIPSASQSGTESAEENRQNILKKVLKKLTVDVAEVVQENIAILTNKEKIRSIQPGQPLPEDVNAAFTNLLDIIDDIDAANDFYKIGGFAIFPTAYGSENDEVRARASTVLAEVCQNNPFCQAKALNCGLLHVLMHMAQRDRGVPLSQNLYAISCIVRGYPPALQELLEQGSCVTLVQILETSDDRAVTRAAFLVRYLCDYDDFKKQFIKLNIVQTMATQIKSGRSETTEHLLSSLLGLIEDQNPTVMTQCRDPNVELKDTLEQHLKHPDLVGERFSEEREYCQQLLSKIFVNYSQGPDPVKD